MDLNSRWLEYSENGEVWVQTSLHEECHVKMKGKVGHNTWLQAKSRHQALETTGVTWKIQIPSKIKTDRNRFTNTLTSDLSKD